MVTKNGAVLNGVNFGGRPSRSGRTTSQSKIRTFGAVGSAVSRLTAAFPGPPSPRTLSTVASCPRTPVGYGSQGQITVTDNKFINSPGDGVDLGSGIVSGNYFEGVGNTSGGQHADAIWVTNSQGPVTISNNFIDWVADGTESDVNNAVRITTRSGSVNNVTVTGNYLLGGSYTIPPASAQTDRTLTATSTWTTITSGSELYGAFYPGAKSGVTAERKHHHRFHQSDLFDRAWAAYRAAGIPTTRCRHLNRREYLQHPRRQSRNPLRRGLKGAPIRRVWAKPISSAASAAKSDGRPGSGHLHRTRRLRCHR